MNLNSLQERSSLSYKDPSILSKDECLIYTDGSYSRGVGGCAVIVIGRDFVEMRCRFANNTTNNRMEIIPVMGGITIASRDHGCTKIHFFSDSQYVVKSFNLWMHNWHAKGWKRGKTDKVKNLGLWQNLYDLKQKYKIKGKWVRGHSGHEVNELCDKLAVWSQSNKKCLDLSAKNLDELKGKLKELTLISDFKYAR